MSSELRYIAVHQLVQSFRLLLLLQKVMRYIVGLATLPNTAAFRFTRHFGRALQRRLIKRGICYTRMSVHPSVCHTCKSRLNGSRYRNRPRLRTILYSRTTCLEFLDAKFRNREFRGSRHAERVYTLKKALHPRTAKT